MVVEATEQRFELMICDERCETDGLAFMRCILGPMIKSAIVAPER